jgi:hypothetical protein
MADKKTSLITGSNAKIKLNGVTLAYAVDVQYDVSVATIPVETMGRYEVLANEPIATTVAGSFTIVRYTAAAKAGQISGAAEGGNGIGNWGTKAGEGAPADGRANKGLSTHVNPGDILTSTTVDIELFRKTQNDPTATTGVEFFMKIHDARITRMAGSVNKRGILMETFQFVAEMADNESFDKKPSGEEDLST